MGLSRHILALGLLSNEGAGERGVPRGMSDPGTGTKLLGEGVVRSDRSHLFSATWTGEACGCQGGVDRTLGKQPGIWDPEI